MSRVATAPNRTSDLEDIRPLHIEGPQTHVDELVDRGGYFAHWEERQLFTEEIRAAFRSVR